MTMITGALTDYALMTEGQFAGYYGARIDDKPYVVMHHVDAFLLRLKKGQRVEASLNKDGHISKIVPVKDSPESSHAAGPDPDKLKKHGFGESTPGPAPAAAKSVEVPPARAPDELFTDEEVAAMKEKAAAAQRSKGQETCTSPAPGAVSPKEPAKSASEFWEILGFVETIDAPGRKATASDEHGVFHPITWAAGYLDEKFAKLKPGYYRRFSGETNKPGVVTAIGWMGTDEPEWVKARYKALHPSGGGGGKPRNEKPIIYQCCYKEQMANFRQNFPMIFESLTEGGEAHRAQLEKVMDWYLDRACADAARLVRESGA